MADSRRAEGSQLRWEINWLEMRGFEVAHELHEEWRACLLQVRCIEVRSDGCG